MGKSPSTWAVRPSCLAACPSMPAAWQHASQARIRNGNCRFPPGLPQGWQQPWLSVVSVSNPHTVLRVEDVETAPVEQLGPVLESHPRFARRVNVGFLQVTGPHEARLRVYERGAGETLACGSGACAAVVTGIRQGDLISPVRVQTRGGVLTIAWDGQQLRMTGPAVTVYHGEIDIDRLVAQQLPAGC